MPAKDINTSTPGLDVKEILRELEVPFSPDQLQWRVTVTAKDRKRVRSSRTRIPSLFRKVKRLRSSVWLRLCDARDRSGLTRLGRKMCEP